MTDVARVALTRWLIGAALLLWCVSLALPAVDISFGPAASGFDVLQQGAGGWRDGVFAWYANPLFLLAAGLVWFEFPRFATAAAVVALALGLSSFAAESTAANAGRTVPPFSFGLGFYLWLVALAIGVTAAAIGLYKESKLR